MTDSCNLSLWCKSISGRKVSEIGSQTIMHFSVTCVWYRLAIRHILTSNKHCAPDTVFLQISLNLVRPDPRELFYLTLPLDMSCVTQGRLASHSSFLKVSSHWASMLTFASAFASNFNIVSIVMLTLIQRMGIKSILCNCMLLTLLLLFSKTQMQTLTLSVNGP